MRRARWKVTAGLILLLLFAAIILAKSQSDPRARRRLQILAWKFGGSLPYVSWRETMRAMLPGRWRFGSSSEIYFVREKARGEEPCPVLWSTPVGDFWGQLHDNDTLRDLPHVERYQSGPVTIRSGDVVVDVGSQIGTFTRIALQKGAKQVVAIEPDPGSNACFKRTFEKEIAEGRVILMEAALWETSGTLKFTVASRSDAGAVTSEFDPQWGATRIVEVQATSMDDAATRLSLPSVDFIKWGIGDDTLKRALHGAQQTISRFRPRMVMWIDGDPVETPPIVLRSVPTYHIFTHEIELAYFY